MNFLSYRAKQVNFDSYLSDSLVVFPKTFQVHEIQLYADDVWIYREIEDCNTLQMDLIN